MTQYVLEKFFSDSRMYLSRHQPTAASAFPHFSELARPGRLPFPLPEREPSTPYHQTTSRTNEAT